MPVSAILKQAKSTVLYDQCCMQQEEEKHLKALLH